MVHVPARDTEFELMLEWQVGVLPVTVEEISLQQGPALLLAGPIVFRFIFVVSIIEFVKTFKRPDDTRS